MPPIPVPSGSSELVRSAKRPPCKTLTPSEVRVMFSAGREVPAPDPPPVREIRELAAPRAGFEAG